MTSELMDFASVSLIKSGKHTLIAGLHWQWVPARGARRMRIEARDLQASYWLALPAGSTDETASWLGTLSNEASELPKGSRAASLTVALAEKLPADCWGVFLLPDGQWWLMAMAGGRPSPYGDITGDADLIKREAERFKSDVTEPAAGWAVFDPDGLLEYPGARTDSLESLLPSVVPDRANLRKTEDKAPRRLIFLAVVLAGAGWLANHWWEEKKQADHEAWVQAELIKKRNALVQRPASLARPWEGQPAFSDMLSACVKQWRQAPVSIAGWVFSRALCEVNGKLTIHYSLPDGGTVGDFAARLPAIYGAGTQAVFNMPGPSDDASFREHVDFKPTPAESLLPGDEQLRRMTSYAQRLRASLRFSEPVILDQTLGQDHVPLPWKRYSFTFITDIPPDRLFDASRFPGNGLRLSSVKVELHSSRLTYTLEGMLYADK